MVAGGFGRTLATDGATAKHGRPMARLHGAIAVCRTASTGRDNACTHRMQRRPRTQRCVLKDVRARGRPAACRSCAAQRMEPIQVRPSLSHTNAQPRGRAASNGCTPALKQIKAGWHAREAADRAVPNGSKRSVVPPQTRYRQQNPLAAFRPVRRTGSQPRASRPPVPQQLPMHAR